MTGMTTAIVSMNAVESHCAAARVDVEVDHQPRDRVDHDGLVEDHHEGGEPPASAARRRSGAAVSVGASAVGPACMGNLVRRERQPRARVRRRANELDRCDAPTDSSALTGGTRRSRQMFPVQVGLIVRSSIVASRGRSSTCRIASATVSGRIHWPRVVRLALLVVHPLLHRGGHPPGVDGGDAYAACPAPPGAVRPRAPGDRTSRRRTPPSRGSRAVRRRSSRTRRCPARPAAPGSASRVSSAGASRLTSICSRLAPGRARRPCRGRPRPRRAPRSPGSPAARGRPAIPGRRGRRPGQWRPRTAR